MKKEYGKFIRDINIPRTAHIKDKIEYQNGVYNTTIMTKIPKPTRIKIKGFIVDWNVGGLINVWKITFTPLEGWYKGLTFTHEDYGLDKLLNQYGRRRKRKVRRLE